MLIEVGRLFQQSLREADALARWGGEEFILLMPDTDLAAATVVMERIRTIAEQSFVPSALGNIHFTLSFGLTVIRSEDTLAEAFSRADMALYRSKNEGRNRVTALA